MAKNWNCIDCNKLIWNRYKRCHSCCKRGNKNSNFNKGLKGKDNPNWRGGVAKNNYSSSFKDRIRYYILDYYKECQYCYSKEDLVVHHLNHNIKDNTFFNLITLCRSCNTREIFSQKYYQYFLSVKIQSKLYEIIS